MDLHVHTSASDGTDSPEKVVALAAKRGLSVLAVTDHDTMAGIPGALQTGKDFAIQVIPGIEISADFNGQSVHILGLGLHKLSNTFRDLLENIQDGRKNRNPRIVSKLQQLGLDMSIEDVEACAGGEVIGRLHIAQAMTNKGYVESVEHAFKQYLTRGSKAYVERFRPSAAQAIEIIKDSGGITVLAHPGYMNYNNHLGTLKKHILTMKRLGLDALESHYPSHTRAVFDFLNNLAIQENLLLSGGSDYHGHHKPNQLGMGFDNGIITEEDVKPLLERLNVFSSLKDE